MPAFMDNEPRKKGRKPAPERKLEKRGKAFDVSTLDNATVWESIAVVIAAGGAIRLGLTRDGGALAVGIYGDGEPYTEYVRGGDDVIEFFVDVRKLFEVLE